MLAYFIYSFAFDMELDISDFCCNIYLYQTNVKDLNNVKDKISTFKLHSIIGYLSLCYFTTKDNKLQ